MPRYLIERNVPGAHNMSAEELHSAANQSCDVLDQLGSDIEWEQSFITEDRITCVYVARDEDMVREHAGLSGFPANRIQEIRNGISPATAEPRKEVGHVR
ncbi:MAG: DUF4242 domain-containing protein [Gemmatimonadales bacterium]